MPGKYRYSLLIVTLLIAAAASEARILDADDAGFTVEIEAEVEATRGEVYQAFVNDVGRWWAPELTVSGVAESLYIDPRPQGCFCEALTNGGIVHMTVTLVDANNMLRLTGGFGPLGLMGVSGNMTVEFSDTVNGSSVRLHYAVGGYHPDGLEAMAIQVDEVLEAQVERLRRFVETGNVAVDESSN